MASDVPTKSVAERTNEPMRLILVAMCEDITLPFELDAERSLTFGRADDCELRIDHPSISRKHARIQASNPVTVEDLGSRNRTRVRGIPIAAHQPVPIQPGDVFECGDALLVLRALPLEGPTSTMTPRDALAATSLPVRKLVVGMDARWFEAAAGSRVNLGRRGPLRRLLLRLVDERVARPGVGLSIEQMVAAGWPGEKMQHEAGLARVYTSVQRLRSLGLQGALVTQDDGYLISPAIEVRREEAQ